MRENFYQAKQRQFLRVPPGIQACGLHVLAANAGKAGLRVPFPELFHQGGAELVAGSFAGYQCDCWLLPAQRMKLFSVMSRKSTRGLISS